MKLKASFTGVVRVLLSGAALFLVGVIAFLRPLLFVRFSRPADSSPCDASATSSALKLSDSGFAALDPMLFLGLPLRLFGDDSGSAASTSDSCSEIPGTIIFRPVALGFGVPFRLTGPSKDFLGLPRPRFTAAGLESSAAFSGTEVVLVLSARCFEGDLAMFISGSASTVTLIRQGLRMSWADWAEDLEGVCGAEGVLR